MLSNLFNDTSLGKLVYDTEVQTELENQSINLQWKHNCHVSALHPPEGKTVVGIPFSNALGVCGWSVISQKFLFQQNFKIRKHCKNSARNFFVPCILSPDRLTILDFAPFVLMLLIFINLSPSISLSIYLSIHKIHTQIIYYIFFDINMDTPYFFWLVFACIFCSIILLLTQLCLYIQSKFLIDSMWLSPAFL